MRVVVRQPRIASMMLLCIAAMAAGCGDSGSDDEAPSSAAAAPEVPRIELGGASGPQSTPPPAPSPEPPPEPRITVPRVVGMAADRARSTLSAEGLQVAWERTPRITSDCEVTRQQNPPTPAVGELVTLAVACAVPNVVGDSALVAETRLELAGFAIGWRDAPNDKALCNVASQDRDSMTAPGDKVTLAVECQEPLRPTVPKADASPELPPLPSQPPDTTPELPPLPRSSPGGTTEDFGSGRGRVGACADGTLSDSIGRPGACSHHGGVP